MARRPFSDGSRGDEQLVRQLPALWRQHRPDLMVGEKLYRSPAGFTNWNAHWAKAVAVELALERSESIADHVGIWGAMVCQWAREIGAEPRFLSPALAQAFLLPRPTALPLPRNPQGFSAGAAMDSRRLVAWIAAGILGFQGGTLVLDLLNCSVLSWLYVRRHGLELSTPAPATPQKQPVGEPLPRVGEGGSEATPAGTPATSQPQSHRAQALNTRREGFPVVDPSVSSSATPTRPTGWAMPFHSSWV
jgi:hypothetical protein